MHVDVICTKASKRLYALRLLKRSALPDLVLVNVYRTCVSPILEYACEAWHSFLPTYLSDQIESVQRISLPVVYILALIIPRICRQLDFYLVRTP